MARDPKHDILFEPIQVRFGSFGDHVTRVAVSDPDAIHNDKNNWAFGTGPDPTPPLFECGFADLDDIVRLGCETESKDCAME